MSRTAEEILKERYRKQNEYNKAKYQRITILAPPGTSERVKNLGVGSVSKFILDLLLAELDRLERSAEQEPLPIIAQEPEPAQTYAELQQALEQKRPERGTLSADLSETVGDIKARMLKARETVTDEAEKRALELEKRRIERQQTE